MRIKTVYDLDKDDWSESYSIEVDGIIVVDVGTPEPEDATLSRDMNFAYSIVPLMKQAYEAGLSGETFEVEKIDDTV